MLIVRSCGLQERICCCYRLCITSNKLEVTVILLMRHLDAEIDGDGFQKSRPAVPCRGQISIHYRLLGAVECLVWRCGTDGANEQATID